MGNRRDRIRRPARREPYLTPKPMLLAVCEGRATEPEYLKGFATECGNPRVRLVIAPGAGVPLSVVAMARDRKRDAEQQARRENDENLRFESVWAVFDIDEHPRIPEAIEMARDNGIRLAVSNPSFELWLLLHFTDQPGMQSRDAVREKLKNCLPGYDKHVNYKQFRDGYDIAVTRATPLGKCNLTTCQHGPNPSTEVHELTEWIKNS